MYNKRILGGDANEGVNNHITDSISTGDTPYSIIGGATDGGTGGANGKERKRMYKKEQCSPGDNDVDGITGATLLYEHLNKLGAKVDLYISQPH